MKYSQKTIDFTEDIKQRAIRYGFNMVGIVSADTYDEYPGHYIGHRDYLCDTGKTSDYLEGAKSLIILGIRVWDDLFDMVVRVDDHMEYPDEWRGRYYARRMMRHLNKLGYETVLEPDLLSKKRMAQMGGIGQFGKQSLIIHPEYGPWIRLRSILTDAELVPTEPFTEDLCGDCDECVKACPVGALSPYEVDPDKCLLGLKWEDRLSPKYKDVYLEHSPSLTENTWKMCNTCQQACPIGRELRHADYGRSTDLE
ncbi:MAG TPA: epoxyqueuosine reductase [Candidatus Bathyarchaeota archaeon]|nr:epoxyqueuosine reductase [Candidatus Bathyarchaeota archaeon]